MAYSKANHSIFRHSLLAGVGTIALSAVILPSAALAQDQEPPPPSALDEPADAGDVIIVTGSRIARPEVESPSPVSVVSTQDIKLQGATRVEDILNSLPAVSASQGSSQANGADGTASVDLRGLGTSRTLALINGRRIVPGDPSNSSGSAADINIIPAAMLKRVEVLTGGASSTYGADAVSGVVNFVIDKDFEGVRVDANYGVYQHNNNNDFIRPFLEDRGFDYPDGSTWDGDSFDATIAFGSDFNDSTGHFLIYGGYRNIKAVTQSKRDYSACVIQNTSSGANQCGGSATSPNGNVLVFDTAVTTGTSTFYTFTPNGGFDNDLVLYNFAPLNYYQRNDERYTAGAFIDYEISPAIRPYMEFQFMDDHTTAQIAPSGDFGNTLTINCDNPLMSGTQRGVICDTDNLINGVIGTFPTATTAPYNVDPSAPVIDFADGQGGTYNQAYFLLLRRNVEGGPRRAQLDHTSYRGVLGVNGELDDIWSYDAYYQYGKVKYSQIYENEFSVARLRNALDAVVDNRSGSATEGQIVCRSVITGADPNCVPYNVFAGAGGASEASVNYLSAVGFQRGETEEQVANVSFTGDLTDYGVAIPWASEGVKVNVGAEWRKESLDLQTDQAFQTGDLTGQGGATLPISGSFKVLEFFAETQVPIIEDGIVESFSVSAGYRRSHYTTSADRSYNTDTFKIGAEVAPISDIRLRAMYNRAVRAPNIQELFSTPAVGLNGSVDPCAGDALTDSDYGCLAQGLTVGRTITPNPAGQYNALLGGNPDLQPEKASTWTVGFVSQPSFAPRLFLSVDYFNIKINNAIRSFGPDTILNDCVGKATADFTPASCALVHRDTAGSLWLTPDGYTSDLPNNVGSVQTAGVEVASSYNLPISFGSVSFQLNGTYLDKYKVDNGLADPYDCAGLYGPTCSIGGTTDAGAPLPRWRHKARVTLQTDSGFGFSVQWRYVGKVKAETLSSYAALQGEYNFEPGLNISAYNYIDTTFQFSLNSKYSFRLGINNLFDKEPPLITSGSSSRAGSNLCPTGPCNGNTYPGTWDALGRYLFAGVTADF